MNEISGLKDEKTPRRALLRVLLRLQIMTCNQGNLFLVATSTNVWESSVHIWKLSEKGRVYCKKNNLKFMLRYLYNAIHKTYKFSSVIFNGCFVIIFFRF